LSILLNNDVCRIFIIVAQFRNGMARMSSIFKNRCNRNFIPDVNECDWFGVIIIILYSYALSLWKTVLNPFFWVSGIV
jgi:hypothetical protein